MTAWEKFTEILDQVGDIVGATLFEINQTPISISSILMFLFVLLIFMIISRIIVRGVLGRVMGRFEVDQGLRYTLQRLSHYLLMIIGAVVAFQFVGIDLSGLAVIFGLLSVGIGFGLQNVTSNFVAGLILLFERPIRVGDRVTVGDTEGNVTDINMRSTTIRSIQNITIIVPNSDFVSNKVTNWSHGDMKIRLDIEVGVSYGSDLDLVLQTLKQVALDHKETLDDPAPGVALAGFGDSSWNMKLLAWIADPQQHLRIRSELRCAIVEAFRKNKIEIPFPQRDLHVRSPLPVPIGKGTGTDG